MAYYNTCPLCGSNLDPGEPCDCKREEEKESDRKTRFSTGGETYGQFAGAGGTISRYGDRAARVG